MNDPFSQGTLFGKNRIYHHVRKVKVKNIKLYLFMWTLFVCFLFFCFFGFFLGGDYFFVLTRCSRDFSNHRKSQNVFTLLIDQVSLGQTDPHEVEEVLCIGFISTAIIVLNGLIHCIGDSVFINLDGALGKRMDYTWVRGNVNIKPPLVNRSHSLWLVEKWLREHFEIKSKQHPHTKCC